MTDIHTLIEDVTTLENYKLATETVAEYLLDVMQTLQLAFEDLSDNYVSVTGEPLTVALGDDDEQ